jgi:hypothetical protein
MEQIKPIKPWGQWGQWTPNEPFDFYFGWPNGLIIDMFDSIEGAVTWNFNGKILEGFYGD